MAKACVFCGGRPVSTEHVWPQWLRTLDRPAASLKEARAADPSPHYVMRGEVSEDFSTAVGYLRPRGKSVPPMDVTVKVPCRECNQGWMSRLEAHTKGLLTSMMNGERRLITEREARQLAFWTAKTAAMFQHNDPTTMTVQPGDLVHMYTEQEPPPGMAIFVGRATAPIWMMRLRHTAATVLTPEQLARNIRPARMNTSSTAVCPDSVFLLTAFSCAPTVDLLRRGPRRLVRLWPGPRAFDWPMRDLTDEEIESACEWPYRTD